MDLISGFIFVIVGILTIAYVYIEYAFNYWKYRGIPFEKPCFPWGNAKGVGTTIHLGDFIKTLYDKHKPSGAKIFGVYASIKPMAVILDLELAKTILVRDFANFNERGLYIFELNLFYKSSEKLLVFFPNFTYDASLGLYYNEKDDPISGNLLS